MWDLIVSVPDHCLSFYVEDYIKSEAGAQKPTFLIQKCL